MSLAAGGVSVAPAPTPPPQPTALPDPGNDNLHSVSDPYSFDTDPFHHSRLNTDPDPIRIRIQGFDNQKLKKFTAEKLQFTYP